MTAYDGITVLRQVSTVKVYFDGTRPLVIDPRLVPKIESKSTQGTTAHSTAFRTNLSESTPIGGFKGKVIFMKSPDMLFNSKNVYITNMTVDDTR